MSKYTPTTEQVEERYIYDRYENAEGTQVLEEAEAEFRRWLAVHEAAIRADERSKVLAEQGEPEWEYGYASIADAEAERPTMRRRKAGPWVRVEPVNEGEKP